MKIYLDNRVIRLSKNKTFSSEENASAYEYSSPEELKQRFEEFEKSSYPCEITIWSDTQYDQLKKDFFSLFTLVRAAGGLVRNEKSEYLVIFRNFRWDLPKGKLASKKPNTINPVSKIDSTSELPGDGALREVMEETGLSKIRIVSELPSTYHIYTQNNIRFLKKTFWFGMIASSDQLLTPETGEGISEVKWVTADELARIGEITYPSLKKVIKNVLKS